MPFEIHAVMEDAHDIQFILHIFVEDNMRLLADGPQSGREYFRAAAQLRIVLQGPETGLKLVAIPSGLVDPKFGYGVIGYPGQIIFGAAA